MKIPLVHNSYQTPGDKDQAFTQETNLLRSCERHVLLYQSNPAVQTITAGAGE